MDPSEIDEPVWEVVHNGVKRTLSTIVVIKELINGSLNPYSQIKKSFHDSKFDVVSNVFPMIGPYASLSYLANGAYGKVSLGIDTRTLENEKHERRFVAIKEPNDAILESYTTLILNQENSPIQHIIQHFKESPSYIDNQVERRYLDHLLHYLVNQSARTELGQRYAMEALLTARLASCPFAVAVLDCNVSHPALILEYCKDGTFESRIKGDYGIQDVYNWGYQIATVLNCAHSLRPDQLILRDLKPDNILMSGDELKLCDFGTSKMINEYINLVNANPASMLGGFTPA